MGLQASDGFELDDDPSRVDPDVVWRYLSDWSYWGRGRTRAFVIQTIERPTASSGSLTAMRRPGSPGSFRMG